MIWIDETKLLEVELEGLGAGPLALDTEADSFYHFQEKVCLIQVSAGGRDLLIDPLADVGLAALGARLGDPGRRKILHGADYDLRLLRRDLGFELRGLFDTLPAARLVGERKFGLAALLSKYLDVTLDKRFQKADWSKRPLSDEMREYAAMDTRYLHELAGLLERRLVELGRLEWAEEECRAVESAAAVAREPRPESYLRVKGAQRLDRRGLAVLRELTRWREEQAMRRDVPVFRIVRDDVLLELARVRPDSIQGLRQAVRLPRSWGAGRVEDVLARIRSGVELPADALPPPPETTRRPRPLPEEEARLRAVAGRRDALARELDIEPSVLASRAVLEQALAAVDAGQDPADCDRLRNWQAQLLGPILADQRPV